MADYTPPSAGSAPTYNQVSAAGASQALSPASTYETIYDLTLTAACALTLSGASAGQPKIITCILRQNSTGGWAASLPSGVLWPNGFPPSLNTTVGYLDILQFMSVDGVNWIGSLVGTKLTAAALLLAAFAASTIYPGQSTTVSGSYIGAAPTSLDYSLNGGSTWTTASSPTISNGGFSFAITAPAAGSYQVMARNTNATSEATGAQTLTIAPAVAPSSLSLSAGSGNAQAVITMGGSINGAAVTSIQVLRGTTSGGESSTPIATISSGSITNASSTFSATYTDSTVTNGTKYYYEFVATNSAGSTTSSEAAATPSSAAHALIFNGSGGSVSTPVSASAQPVASDAWDVRVCLNLSAYTGNLFGVSTLAAGSGGFGFYFNSSGNLIWSQATNSNGTTALGYATSTATLASVLAAGNKGWVRATCIPSNGATNFYWAPDNNGTPGTWVQIGSQVTMTHANPGYPDVTSGHTIQVGNGAAGAVAQGTIYKAQIYDFTNNILLCECDGTAATTGATSFTDAATSQVWTVNSPASVS